MIVKKQFFQFGKKDEGLSLDSGRSFGPVTVAYETLGKLNADKSNAVLICHALSGDSHVAGRYAPEDRKPGWWDSMVGPGKPFDTDKYFIICSNILGGCRGTTGPYCVNPETGREYGLSFPVVTVDDMVRVQKELIDHLGIEKLLCVAGGSLGGMQALSWAVLYPEKAASAMILASAAYSSALGIAFDKVGRSAIMSDPRWNNGDYYGREAPKRGLAVARMAGHITYLSDEAMRRKFGRNLQDRDSFSFRMEDEFSVESYLEHQGAVFVERFDANSYLYITKAMDYYDLAGKYGSLEKAFAGVKSKFLVVSFTSDWLYPPYQSEEIVKALKRNNKDVSYREIESFRGHDAFLLEAERLGEVVRGFLAGIGG